LRKKPAAKSLRQRSGREPGRVKGDPGGQLEQVADPDAVVEHHPTTRRLRDRGLHARRGRAVMNDFAILPAFTGVLVTDALASYTAHVTPRHCAARTSCVN
jgi:hypothetical protein